MRVGMGENPGFKSRKERLLGSLILGSPVNKIPMISPDL
jgi:hypothetical protein